MELHTNNILTELILVPTTEMAILDVYSVHTWQSSCEDKHSIMSRQNNNKYSTLVCELINRCSFL